MRTRRRSSPDHPAPSPSSKTQAILLKCGLVAPVLFIGSFLVHGVAVPGYDPLRHPVSSLALAGTTGWVQSLTFVLTGALMIGFAIGLRRCELGRATPILIGLVGVGLCGAGLAPTDPISGFPLGTPIPSPRSVHGVMHDLFSTPVFVALPVACLVMAWRFLRRHERRWAGYSVVTASVFVVSFVLAAVGFAQTPGWVSWGGMWQRIALVAGLLWILLLARWLDSGHRPERTVDAPEYFQRCVVPPPRILRAGKAGERVPHPRLEMGLVRHESVISSITLSVILEMVSLEIKAP
jgi:hypothetical membrane protein